MARIKNTIVWQDEDVDGVIDQHEQDGWTLASRLFRPFHWLFKRAYTLLTFWKEET